MDLVLADALPHRDGLVQAVRGAEHDPPGERLTREVVMLRRRVGHDEQVAARPAPLAEAHHKLV
ncbi:MAG: hypothetical protein Q8P31_11525 [Bacillota bacterium]|nr:hypothetical protein [Bacillota bacterium]